MESERWSAHRDRTFTIGLTGAELEILCGALQLIASQEGAGLFALPGAAPTSEIVQLRELTIRRGELHKKLTALAR